MDTIRITQGDYEEFELEFLDEDDAAVDITGATVFMTVKESIEDDDEDAIIQKVVTSHTDASAGLSKVILNDSDTELLEINFSYFMDVQLTDALGHPHTPLVAKLIAGHQVTKRVI